MEIKGVFFDMDGVVIDSSRLWNDIITELSAKYNLDLMVVESAAMKNLSTKEAMKLVLESMGMYSDALLDDILEDIDVMYEKGLRPLTSVIGGIPEILQLLGRKSIARVIVSNSTRKQVAMVLRYYGLEDSFDYSVASDDVSKGKPDAEPYLKALQLTGLAPEEALVVEDSDTGVSAAGAASIECIKVSPNSDFEIHDILLERLEINMKKIVNPWKDLESQGYNCFGCAPGNPFGLKMEFFEDGDDIVSYWSPSDNYQGWLRTLHGGIHSALMDEIAMWVIARKLQTSGMTTTLTVKFKKPVPTGPDVKIEIRSRIRETKRNFVFLDAEIRYNGEICSTADITYYCFPKEKAASDFYFNGCRTEDEL